MRLLVAISILSIFFIACDSKSREIQLNFEKHSFDSSVIARLNSYDSLRHIILANLPKFFKGVAPVTEGSKYGLKTVYTNRFYYAQSHNIVGVKFIDELPPSLFQSLKKQFDLIGPKNITGFEIRSDSTLFCYIRITHILKFYLDVRESLSWQNTDNEVFPKGPLIKDTILKNNWTYHIWYDKRAE